MTDKSDATPENPPQQQSADPQSEEPLTFPEIGTVRVRADSFTENPTIGVERILGEIVVEYPEVGQAEPPRTAQQGQ